MKKLDSNFWNRYFKVYDILNLAIPYQEMMEEVISRLDIKPGEAVLDAGSGTGNLAVKVEKIGAQVYALDNNITALNIYKTKNPQAKTIRHDLNSKLPFSDNYFDKIASINTLYLLPQNKRTEVIKEFFRILNPGGRVVIVNPRYGAQPFKIYSYHIKKSLKEIGLIKTICQAVKLFWSTGLVLYYTFIIKKQSKRVDYDLLKANEIFDSLNKAGFSKISKSALTYADQAFLDMGFKVGR